MLITVAVAIFQIHTMSVYSLTHMVFLVHGTSHDPNTWKARSWG